MKEKETRVRYLMYCRKSSEAEDKQVQSIEDQVEVLTALAERNGFEIVDVLQEAHSAKAPGRPVFTEMIERISRGEADGILVWKLNRLARNPVDGGTISWLLQQGIVRHIQAHDRSYYPGDNVIVMAVELGMANQYVRDLSVDTKRGIKKREKDRGLPNGRAPIGFLNDMTKKAGDRGWAVDEDRFYSVKELLRLYSTGRYSIQQLVNIANDQMGLRTPQYTKQGGRRLTVSYVAGTLLRSPVYAGFFFNNEGTRYELQGDLPRALTEEEYWRNQEILGRKGRPRPSLNVGFFPYKELMACSCAGCITAEKKSQLICSVCKHKFAYSGKATCPKCRVSITQMTNPKYLHYIYYHCTRKKDPACNQGSIREDQIDEFLSSYFLENLNISRDLADWCINNLELLDASDKESEFVRKESLKATLSKLERELRELVMMKARGLLGDDDFTTAMQPLKAEIESLKAEITRMENGSRSKLQGLREAFDLTAEIARIFENGGDEQKKQVLLDTGSNLTLKDRKLSIRHADLYEAIVGGLKRVKAEYPSFEPENSKADKDETGTFVPVRPTLLRG